MIAAIIRGEQTRAGVDAGCAARSYPFVWRVSAKDAAPSPMAGAHHIADSGRLRKGPPDAWRAYFRQVLRPSASFFNAGLGAWFARAEINSAFLTNRRTHIYDSYPEERLPSGRILHYGLVLSAVKKCWATGSALSLKMFHNAVGGDQPVGLLRLFEKRFRHHHRGCCEPRPAHGYPLFQASGSPLAGVTGRRELLELLAVH
jgi:hypothetical protein